MASFNADPANTYTYTIDVPATVKLYGAGGSDGGGSGSTTSYPGGNGGYIELEVEAGTTLVLAVGEGGTTPAGGSSPAGDGGDGQAIYDYDIYGGGGGGATTVTRQSDGVMLAAAGGGGGGAASDDIGIGAGGGGGARGGSGGNTAGDGEGSGAGGDGGYTDYQASPGGTMSGGGVTVNTTQAGGGNNGDAVVEVILPVPADPTNLTQNVIDDDAVDVSWGGNEDASEYVVQVQEDGGGWTTVTTTSSTTITYNASPSTNTHRFRVQATNADNESGWAYTNTVATDPSGLTASGVGFGPISLTWDGARDASGYRIFRATDPGAGAGDYTEIATIGATQYDDDAAANNQTYYYRVQAIYSGTNSQLSNEAADSIPYGPPVLDTVEATTGGEVDLSWSLQDDSADGSVEICRSTDGSLGSVVKTFGDPQSVTQWTDATVLDGVEYHYTVRRAADGQTADSGRQSVTTSLPAPTDLVAVDVRDMETDVEWTATHDNGETRVEYREDDDGNWSVDQTVPYDTEQATIEGLLNGQLYGVRVVADTGDAEEAGQ